MTSSPEFKFVNTIQATPGFHVLEVLQGENGSVEALQCPVIAWALEEDTLAPYPITLEGVRTADVYILQPNGQVERPCAESYPSVAEWIKGQQENFAALRKAGK